jgi:hypothetical protein
MMYSRAQMILLRRMLKTKRGREKREGRVRERNERVVGRVFCWRCRMPLSRCTCPLLEMELWYA